MAKPKSNSKPSQKPAGKPDPNLSRQANINHALLGQMARNQGGKKK